MPWPQQQQQGQGVDVRLKMNWYQQGLLSGLLVQASPADPASAAGLLSRAVPDCCLVLHVVPSVSAFPGAAAAAGCRSAALAHTLTARKILLDCDMVLVLLERCSATAFPTSGMSEALIWARDLSNWDGTQIPDHAYS
jgi:hypothetical protein